MSNLFDTDNAPLEEPRKIIAGDFLAWWRKDLSSDYPPASYDLSYQCRRVTSAGSANSTKISIVATETDGHFLVSVGSSDTASYAIGHYYWSAYITRQSDSERIEIDHGELEVFPDKASSNEDPASLARRMLTYIDAAIEQRATNHQLDVLNATYGEGESVTRNPEKLLMHRAYWRSELARANRKTGLRSLGVKF